MDFFNYFQENSQAAIFFIGLIGLLVGSFLNVVIYRIPHMLYVESIDTPSSLNLLLPASHCPHCEAPLRWYHNIPLFSFIFLRGKCNFCQQKISLQYPLVELLSCVLSLIVANHYGFTLNTLFALLLTWSLITLAVIDYQHMILPDNITLPVLWLGLFVNGFGYFTDPVSAIQGAIGGYLALWCVYWVFKILTHKEGMGYGDFKLLAMLGAWLGYQSLPLIIFFSSFLGSIFGISSMVLKNQGKDVPIPFGPFIACTGFIVMIQGFDLADFYYKLIML